MTKGGFGKADHVDVGFVHIAIAMVIIGSIFMVSQLYLIPSAISGAIVPLFRPTGEELAKFAEFDDGVFAQTKSVEIAQATTTSDEIAKDKINKEYIFDMSYQTRDLEENGYMKSDTEFYVKAPALGENAIILEPWLGFSILSLVIGILVMILVTMMMPASLGLMAALFAQQIHHVKVKIRLQTGFTDEVVNILAMPDSQLSQADRFEVERAFRKVWDRTGTDGDSGALVRFDDLWDEDTDIVFFRNEAIYNRIKEFFSEFVLSEIEDTKNGLEWDRNHFKVFKGLRLYMAHHFSEKYSNNVTGAAYIGAAVLIIAVGIRGLKFIPATKPSAILGAIFLEFSLLSLMGVTLLYTEEEERMDKMLKKMEDANRNQLELLRGQQADIHNLANALIGQNAEIIKERVQQAISEHMTDSDKVREIVGRAIVENMTIGFTGDKPTKA
ncbi:MAG: hypothetical protein Kapaf2KO_13630 [Candidatus Kapaibacteriales bacterium]